MNKFKGLFAALLTPFNSDWSINEASVKKLIDFNIANGTDGFYVGGSTGEGMVLTNEERKELFKIAADANAGRKTMIAHVGTISTDAAIDMAKCAEALGYDAVSAVAPYYYSFSPEAVTQYYKDIAASVSLPVIIYNFPGSGGVAFTVDMAKELFKNPQFIAVKHTSADMFAISKFKSIDKDVIVYNGFDETLLAGLAMGADGAIGSTYNFMGAKFKKIMKLFSEGKIEEAQALQYEANDIITEMCKFGVFQSEKAILTEMGIDMGECRRPFPPISDECRESMKKIAVRLMQEG